jgi:hypothetical protein
MPRAKRAKEVGWRPQPGPQWLFLITWVLEKFIGGGRGGGKSDAIIGDWLNHARLYGKHARGIYFRRSYTELVEVQRRLTMLMPIFGWTPRDGGREWVHPNGATLLLRYIKRDSDIAIYQGWQLTWLAFDEVTNYASPYCIDAMRACLRSPNAPVPCSLVLSGNPGGIGHNWVKARYVDPWAQGMRPITSLIDNDQPELGTSTRIYIPALLKHNKKLVENDPEYWKRVAQSGPKHLVNAWLHGLWNIIAGGMFDDVFDINVHVIPRFVIPPTWYLNRSFDWGSSSPFAVLWWAESDGSDAIIDGKRVSFPRGTLFLIREWYGWSGKVNEGVKMSNRDIAKGVKEREKRMTIIGNRKVQPGPADTQIWSNMGTGATIASDFLAEGVHWTEANKASGTRVAGWSLLRQRFSDTRKICHVMERPGLYVFDDCTQFIRTVPSLTRSDKDLDDVADNSEDHIGDAARYRLLVPKAEFSQSRLRL